MTRKVTEAEWNRLHEYTIRANHGISELISLLQTYYGKSHKVSQSILKINDNYLCLRSILQELIYGAYPITIKKLPGYDFSIKDVFSQKIEDNNTEYDEIRPYPKELTKGQKLILNNSLNDIESFSKDVDELFNNSNIKYRDGINYDGSPNKYGDKIRKLNKYNKKIVPGINSIRCNI